MGNEGEEDMTWKLRLDVDLEGVDEVDIDQIRYAMYGANPLAEFPISLDPDLWAHLYVNAVEVVAEPS